MYRFIYRDNFSRYYFEPSSLFLPLLLPSPISEARARNAQALDIQTLGESVRVRGSGKTRSAFVSPAVETLSARLKKYNGFSPREDNTK